MKTAFMRLYCGQFKENSAARRQTAVKLQSFTPAEISSKATKQNLKIIFYGLW